MNRPLDTISEDDERTSSTDPTDYSELPEVTPTTRSFDPETILEQQIKRLQQRLRIKGARTSTCRDRLY